VGDPEPGPGKAPGPDVLLGCTTNRGYTFGPGRSAFRYTLDRAGECAVLRVSGPYRSAELGFREEGC
jgi:hypothetical protein